MKIETLEKNGQQIALVHSDEKVILDAQSALDFMMTVQYETNSRFIALNKEAIAEDFFILSMRIAGEVLQKFINYQMKFAIYGDFTRYDSKALKDFIYECNNGKDLFFVTTKEEAIDMLAR